MKQPMGDLALKIRQYLEKKSFAKNVMVLMSGSSLAQIILLISSPLLTRLYTPAEFGILAIYLSILSILLTVCSLQYEMTITLPHENEDSANLVVLSFLILFFSSSIFGIGLLLFKNELSILFSTKDLGNYLYLLPISLLGIGGFQILNG
ncbi:hypothetical protein DS031_09685 [Bacillus taeanensis]|uniref:Polysaccharide biosynthesis protein n=1 Tax=Bacillus taeanensis TaxID=273032 RepID=A0A366Y059_9BACI|nr:hypothetical protein DS031_09685 [Bacillus taeanensis]